MEGKSGMTVTFLIGNINPGQVASEFMCMMLGLVQEPLGHGETRSECQGFAIKAHAGPYLDAERNVVVQEFLNHPKEPNVLVFVDSDMHVDPVDLHRLACMVTPERPVVGGWYPNLFPQAGGYYPVAFDWTNTDDGPRLVPVANPTSDDDVEVDCVGTGLMGIHRSLLLSMIGTYDPPTPWFAEVALHGVQMGEDVTFCARVKQMRHPVILAPSIKGTHFKQIAMRPDTHATFSDPVHTGSITTSPSPTVPA